MVVILKVTDAAVVAALGPVQVDSDAGSVQVYVTDELKPLLPVIITVAVTLCPCFT